MDKNIEGYLTLADNVNKIKTEDIDAKEGRIGTFLPELELDMDDNDLIKLKDKWESNWLDHFNKKLKPKQKINEEYWTGKIRDLSIGDNQEKATSDNLIFEALETFLPVATKQNPEPVVEADNTQEGNDMSDLVKKMLVFHADRLKLKLKVKQATRFWALYMLGVIKVGWSMKKNDITTMAIRPQKLILDPNATIEDGEYTGYYIGEYRRDTIANLIKRFPKKKKDLIDSLDEKEHTGTEIQFIEWWTDDYVFWTFKKLVLDKNKNPHWNYEKAKDTVDEYGNPKTVTERGANHFDIRHKPYIFLSVFNLSKHPHDDTSLITQNLSNQDIINKRVEQIKQNVDSMNNGLIVDGTVFTKTQASEAAEALRKGKPIWSPNGTDAVKRDQAPALPGDVYHNLQDMRQELRGIFGTVGIGAGQTKDRTVRGQIMTRSQSIDRIGGGVSEYLEQMADDVFNWWVQLFYTYYDEKNVSAVLGEEKAKKYTEIKDKNPNRKLLVSVREGTMIPKDSMSKRDEAIQLWSAKALDPITLFERLDFPNPREAAEKLYMWMTNPQALLSPETAGGEIGGEPDQGQQPGQPAPGGAPQPGQPPMPGTPGAPAPQEPGSPVLASNVPMK